MATQTVTFCDKCNKEINNSGSLDSCVLIQSLNAQGLVAIHLCVWDGGNRGCGKTLLDQIDSITADPCVETPTVVENTDGPGFHEEPGTPEPEPAPEPAPAPEPDPA